ncbi:MAG TPA: short chain dehydrogenase [Deltaproteobacteria bacterium]|jgi:3-oxoacyl-[acyl-carrier protein] reductase|nr:short chain dehydrogenase [Deltaproteobacteria bacterium]
MAMLDGKVAIVTGGATGLGRCHALELARLGARVVVNDLGAAADGSGRDEGRARAVCEEIAALGGEAIPHFGDVADWNDSKAMIDLAASKWGDVNILVCNAGFLRDAILFNMTEQDFDAVIRVHLKGHFLAMRHATAYWRQRAKAGNPVYGRIVATSSESAFFAPPGQPNYASAKAGIVSLAMGAAQLMQKYGVTANVIMPRARTRMNDSGPLAAMFKKPEQGFDTFAPENVSPLVAWLASPLSQNVSGQVFVIWGKSVVVASRPRLDKKFDSTAAWTVDSLQGELGPHFEKLEPVKDGFTVPAM